MAELVKISEAASIGLHACLWMANEANVYSRARDVCETLGFSVAHFAKVMQALSRAGIVQAVRGPAGGTRLARPPEQITLLQVYEAVDGPAHVEQCLLAPTVCPAACCTLGKVLAKHNEDLRRLLAETTIAALAREFKAHVEKSKSDKGDA